MMMLTMLLACGSPSETPSEAPAPAPEVAAPAEAPKVAVSPKVEQALRVAKAIDADPTKADDALAAEGLTEEAYRALLYAIAADPVMAAAFTAGRP